MNYFDAYQPSSLEPIIRKRRQNIFKKKCKSSGLIFHLPRQIITNDPYSKITKHQHSEKQKNTEFIQEYRKILRQTIFNHTKHLLRPKKTILIENNKSEDSPSHYKPNQKNSKSKSIEILYNTIISHNKITHPQPLQLAVNKFPLIYRAQKQTNSKHKIKQPIFGYQTIKNFSLGDNSKKKNKGSTRQKAQLVPWQTPEDNFQY